MKNIISYEMNRSAMYGVRAWLKAHAWTLYLNKMALSSAQKLQGQGYDGRTPQLTPHVPVTFVKL